MRFQVTSAFAVVLGLGLAASGLEAQETSSQPTTAPPQNAQFVFVNTQAILPQVPGAREAQETFQEEVAGYEAEVAELRTEVDSMLTAYRRQESMLSPEVRQQRQQEILEKQQQLQQRAGELEQRAGQRQQELLKPILDRVGAVIEEIRQENEYNFVLDLASSGVVAADPRLDITQLVVERLRAEGQGSASASPGTPTP